MAYNEHDSLFKHLFQQTTVTCNCRLTDLSQLVFGPFNESTLQCLTIPLSQFCIIKSLNTFHRNPLKFIILIFCILF